MHQPCAGNARNLHIRFISVIISLAVHIRHYACFFYGCANSETFCSYSGKLSPSKKAVPRCMAFAVFARPTVGANFTRPTCACAYATRGPDQMFVMPRGRPANEQRQMSEMPRGNRRALASSTRLPFHHYFRLRFRRRRKIKIVCDLP